MKEMRKARDRVLKTRWVGVDELIPAPFHADLFPLPRDLSGLRRSFERHGYRPEYPLVVKARAGAAGGLEIICGVGRHTVARERGMRRVPVVVRRFEGDEAARAYAIEDSLFHAPASSRPALAHMIVLARALKECGGECTPRQVWEAAGVSPSTYWRASRCVDGALCEAVKKLEGFSECDPPRLAAEVVRRGLNPPFALLLAGKIEVNTVAARGPRSAGQGEKKPPAKGKASETTRLHGGRKTSGGPSGQGAGPAESRPGKKPRRGGKVTEQPLFDGLPT
jgi:hypothetical protein